MFDSVVMTRYGLICLLLESQGGEWLISHRKTKKALPLPRQQELARRFDISAASVNRVYGDLYQEKRVDVFGDRKGKRFFLRHPDSLLDDFSHLYAHRSPVLYIGCGVGAGLKGTPQKLERYFKSRLHRYNLTKKCPLALHSAREAMVPGGVFPNHGLEIYAQDLSVARKLVRNLGLIIIDPDIKRLLASDKNEFKTKRELVPYSNFQGGYDVLILVPFRPDAVFSTLVQLEDFSWSADPVFTFAQLLNFPLRGAEQAADLKNALIQAHLNWRSGGWHGGRIRKQIRAD